MQIFNRGVIRLHRDRVAQNVSGHDIIINEICKLISQRLCGEFGFVLNLGACTGQLLNFFSKYRTIINSDVSEQMLKTFCGLRVVLDEELLPFEINTFDAVISIATLHRINDLPGTLIQVHNILKGKGVFIGTLFGVKTLQELKKSSTQIEGSVSPKVYPFIDVKDAGNLMRRAGFRIAVSDTEDVIIKYKNASQLFTDLKNIGESNAMLSMKKSLVSRSEIESIKQKYMKDFTDKDGLISATFEIITITGIKDVD